MQRHLQLLMESVENLQQETQKLLFYERSLAKQQQMKLQFIQRRVSMRKLLGVCKWKVSNDHMN